LFIDACPLVFFIGREVFDEYYRSAFGFGLQYERRLYEKLSLVGRYDYGYSNGRGGEISSHTFEAHTRYYPTGKAFFLDGMLGYEWNNGYGRNWLWDDGYGMRHYPFNIDDESFICGASLGWRIMFRKLGGFTWELSLGWDFVYYYEYMGWEYWLDWFDGLHRWFIKGGPGPYIVSALGWRF